MKRLVAAASIVVLLSVAVVAFAAADKAPQTVNYVLRVTSAVPGTEAKFDAAILFASVDAPLETFTHETPYELRATGSAASAMFRAQGSVAIQVELVGTQGGKEQSRSTATGRAVVVGDNIVRDAGFIRTF